MIGKREEMCTNYKKAPTQHPSKKLTKQIADKCNKKDNMEGGEQRGWGEAARRWLMADLERSVQFRERRLRRYRHCGWPHFFCLLLLCLFLAAILWLMQSAMGGDGEETATFTPSSSPHLLLNPPA